MHKKISITLDDEILKFVDQSSKNRSSFINGVLWKEKREIFMEELEDAYIEQANDPEFQEEISVWDVAVGDGLD
jgi:predicted DNA-binding protein